MVCGVWCMVYGVGCMVCDVSAMWHVVRLLTTQCWSCYACCCACQHLATVPEVCGCAVQLVEKAFTFPGSTELPIATFEAWQKLCDAFSACGQLSRRHQLLLNPVTYAIKNDKRPAVHQVCGSVVHLVLPLHRHSASHLYSTHAAF